MGEEAGTQNITTSPYQQCELKHNNCGLTDEVSEAVAIGECPVRRTGVPQGKVDAAGEARLGCRRRQKLLLQTSTNESPPQRRREPSPVPHFSHAVGAPPSWVWMPRPPAPPFAPTPPACAPLGFTEESNAKKNVRQKRPEYPYLGHIISVHHEELRLCPSDRGTPPVFAEILSRTPWAASGVRGRMSRWIA
jgi:hypothetical protein